MGVDVDCISYIYPHSRDRGHQRQCTLVLSVEKGRHRLIDQVSELHTSQTTKKPFNISHFCGVEFNLIQIKTDILFSHFLIKKIYETLCMLFCFL